MQIFIFFLIDFWIDFLMDFEDFGKQKSLKNAVGVIKFESFCFLLKHQFLINFWSILRPKMEPKTTKNRSTKQLNTYFFFDCFFVDFWTIFSAMLGSKIDPELNKNEFQNNDQKKLPTWGQDEPT